jgi:hypothetical protein
MTSFVGLGLGVGTCGLGLAIIVTRAHIKAATE